MAAIGVSAETTSNHGRGARELPGESELGLGVVASPARDWKTVSARGSARPA